MKRIEELLKAALIKDAFDEILQVNGLD